MIDLSVPEAQDFFATLPLSYFPKDEAAKLIDGIFVDGSSFRYSSFGGNISKARYATLFAGKMATMAKAQKIFTALNDGEVWGNPLLEYNEIGEDLPGSHWNESLAHYNGAFDEMFGSFSTQNQNGTWNATRMAYSMEAIINASNAGHSIIVHAVSRSAVLVALCASCAHNPPQFPGPATTPFEHRGTGDNTFMVPAWAGPTPIPQDPAAVRAAATARLVESLAPFLIVVSERVFLGYAYFYDIQDGYIPCPADIECGMPDTWYPEFTRKLGPPEGPAVREGTTWRRKFEHASVFVDVTDRKASRIDWT